MTNLRFLDKTFARDLREDDLPRANVVLVKFVLEFD